MKIGGKEFFEGYTRKMNRRVKKPRANHKMNPLRNISSNLTNSGIIEQYALNVSPSGKTHTISALDFVLGAGSSELAQDVFGLSAGGVGAEFSEANEMDESGEGWVSTV